MRNMNVPTILVILGVTGDLTKRKIIPALLNLHKTKSLPDKFRVVGFSRREISDADFRKYVKDIVGEEVDNKFLDLFSYHQGFFDAPKDYASLSSKLEETDRSWGVCTNKLFYLAVPHDLYENIATNIAKNNFSAMCSTSAGMRILIEKPFGNDAKTAESLDALLSELFKEEQIYRIDHYLGKEMMQNILTFRFANNLFESTWNNEHIESINVKFWEKIGIEGRGNFYDATGALRDVGQNHLLQMLALTTMENPGTLTADSVREKRAALLSSLSKIKGKDVSRSTVRAQYLGYSKEKGVAEGSKTETYFRIKAFLDNPRWKGVPVTLESGKYMPEARKEIEVLFKHPVPCVCPPDKHLKNSIIFGMEPEQTIKISLWAKAPGLHSAKVEERGFAMHLEEHGGQAYEKLLMDCIAGDQTLFVSSEEVATSWEFIDEIVAGWKKGLVELRPYEPGEIVKEEEIGEIKKIGILGLGKMGGGLARQLLEKGWDVTGWNRTRAVSEELALEGMKIADHYNNLVDVLPRPRIVWLMLPAGQIVDEVLFGKEGIAKKLSKGDIVIDGGNSFYKDSIRRSKRLEKMGLKFLDAGVSGGPAGARNGATVMVGGDAKTFEAVEALFRDMSVPQGYAHVGGAGAGHFVKMVHNGIEYGMMQSIAEGFAIMKRSKFNVDLTAVAKLYNHGSVIESRLIGWLASAYEKWGRDLKGISGQVGYTGEGEWTVDAAKELGVSAPAIKDAFKFRVLSKKTPSYTGKILSALRNQFGGHAFKEAKPKK
jgi:glucose-6-phosphate 1-dehydrogenase